MNLRMEYWVVSNVKKKTPKSKQSNGKFSVYHIGQIIENTNTTLSLLAQPKGRRQI